MIDNEKILSLVGQAQFYFDRARDPLIVRPEPQAYYLIQDFEEAAMFLAAADLDLGRDESFWAIGTTREEFNRLLDESRRNWNAAPENAAVPVPGKKENAVLSAVRKWASRLRPGV